LLCPLDGHMTEKVGGYWICLRCEDRWQIVTDAHTILGPNVRPVWLDDSKKP
jgi:hypothetical protein